MKNILLSIVLLLSFFSQTSLADYKNCVANATQNINNASNRFQSNDNTYQMYIDAINKDMATGDPSGVSQEVYNDIWNKFKTLQADYMNSFSAFQKELANCRAKEKPSTTCIDENNIASGVLNAHFNKIDSNTSTGYNSKFSTVNNTWTALYGLIGSKNTQVHNAYKSQFEKLFKMKRASLGGKKWTGDIQNFNYFFEGQKDNGLWSKRGDLYNSKKCVEAEKEAEDEAEDETNFFEQALKNCNGVNICSPSETTTQKCGNSIITREAGYKGGKLTITYNDDGKSITKIIKPHEIGASECSANPKAYCKNAITGCSDNDVTKSCGSSGFNITREGFNKTTGVGGALFITLPDGTTQKLSASEAGANKCEKDTSQDQNTNTGNLEDAIESCKVTISALGNSCVAMAATKCSKPQYHFTITAWNENTGTGGIIYLLIPGQQMYGVSRTQVGAKQCGKTETETETETEAEIEPNEILNRAEDVKNIAAPSNATKQHSF